MLQSPMSDKQTPEALTVELPVVRDTVRRKIRGSSLRKIAGEVGMSPTGLQKFLNGSDSYRSTVARLRLWYYAQPENVDTLNVGHAATATQLLTGGLPENQRRHGTAMLIGALSAVYAGQYPGWLVELRRRYDGSVAADPASPL
jgi:transcriptional regulator with XRE-family HTH domain